MFFFQIKILGIYLWTDNCGEYKDDYLLIRSYNRVPGSASS